MPTPLIPCPAPELIEDLRSNRLSRDEARTLREHIAECEKCQARLRGEITATHPYPFLSPPRGPDELGWIEEHRIVGLLGEGGMSIVFEAEDASLKRRVALKVLKPSISDPTTRKRFVQEARLIAALPHEHIVTVYYVGETESGIPYLTLERLEGESLAQRLARDRWLPIGEALAFTREAAEGLAVAHEEGLVHRDIKPDNIWLETRQGQFRRVKLIDFGVARLLVQESDLTAVGSILGTPAYMAPEQAMGKQVDGRADLYSLGCALFHMLTGNPPFASKNIDTMTLLEAVIKGDAPDVQEVAPRLPRPVAALLQQLLARNPDERPASARAVVERLRQIEQADRYECGNLPPLPSQPAAQRMSRRPAILGIWLGIATIGLALIVSLVAALYSFFPRDDKGEEDPVLPNEGSEIPIGLLYSQSGTVAIHERPVLRAMQFAVDEINTSGGVLGRKLKGIIRNGNSREELFAQEAHGLLDQEQVVALFGCWTSSSRKRVAEVCRKFDRFLFYPSSYEGLEDDPHVVYLGGTPNQTVIELLHWVRTKKRKKRFFLVGSEYVYSHAVNEVIQHELKQIDGTVVGKKYYPLGDTQFGTIADEIKMSNADVIINTIDGTSNQHFLTALRAGGITPDKIPTVWTAVSESEIFLFPAEQLVGDYSVSCYFESLRDPANLAFLQRFRVRFPQERVSDPMETAYVAIHLWAKAVETARSTDTAALRKVLPGMVIDSPEGKFRIDKKSLHAERIFRVAEFVQHDGLGDFRIVHDSPRPLPPNPFPDWRSKAEWKQFLDGLYKMWGNRWELHAPTGGTP